MRRPSQLIAFAVIVWVAGALAPLLWIVMAGDEESVHDHDLDSHETSRFSSWTHSAPSPAPN